MRIFLVGIMGSGKTTVGKALSQRLSLPFHDLDDLIEERINMSISDFFAKHGEAEFRLIEQEILRNSFSLEQAIISTGGGAPCFFNNMDEILEHGLSFYLKADIDLLCSRLENEKDKRPLLHKLSNDQLADHLSGLLTKREKFYLKANYTVDAKNPLEEIVSIIRSKV